MRKVATIPVETVTPAVGDILRAQGIPDSKTAESRAEEIAHEALALYRETAVPVFIIEEISKADFQNIFRGEGNNSGESPVQPISLAADRLSLFAATVGQNICLMIAQLFRTNDFALGAMLDAAASEGAEMVAQSLERHYRGYLRESHAIDGRSGTLRFSPGYCGWDITGQKKLFGRLRPAEAGITLNESCLMTPLKSISGVIISGRKEIFEFDDTFSFCRDCADHSCRERFQSLREQ